MTIDWWNVACYQAVAVACGLLLVVDYLKEVRGSGDLAHNAGWIVLGGVVMAYCWPFHIAITAIDWVIENWEYKG